ncbi:MAG: DUF2117 domain-containing protein, partial [Methanomicrobiales archaeon]|nr:DUF2117 domain-containing protein [Methanomicrobiales archaeon]
MRHSAVFTCRSDRAGEIYRALAPETGGMFPRSEVKVALEEGDLLVISAAAEDLSALRAALNLWLRLVSVADEMLELTGKAGGLGAGACIRRAEGMIPDPEKEPGRMTRPEGRKTGQFGDAVMVVHGPEAFDRGDVALLLDLLAPGGTVVAGVMARTAAEESGLPVTFDGGTPSSVIARTGGRVFLVNHGKTPESGRIFGEMVASRLP